MATISDGAPSGAEYAAIFGDARRGGESDRQRDRAVRDERQRIERQGWVNATVINLHPFPLGLNLGELGTVEVPAAATDGPGRLEIPRYRLSMRDLGDGRFMPVAVLPVELAKEVMREYANTGGVFWFEGTGALPAAQLEGAQAAQRTWWQWEFQQAVDSWSRYHQHKMITDRQRDAARELFKLNAIDQLPEWVTITRAQGERLECPQCGESIKRIAMICHFCRTELPAGWAEAPRES